MRFICEGHEYRYLPDSGSLLNNYGTQVARLEKWSPSDEYFYATMMQIDCYGEEFSDPLVVDSIHKKSIDNSEVALGRWLVERYVVSEY